jgi:hypothetical protein
MCARASVRTDILCSINVLAHDKKSQKCQCAADCCAENISARGQIGNFLVKSSSKEPRVNRDCSNRNIFAVTLEISMTVGDRNCSMFLFRSAV